MTPSRTMARAGAFVALAVTVFTWAAPAGSQTQTPTLASANVASDSAPQTASQPVAAGSPAQAAATSDKPTIRQKVKAALSKVNPARLLQDREYQKAASTFTQFCQDWQSKLRDREKFNLSKLVWTYKDGFETATYTGYSSIQSCTTKESAQGFALGKLSYEEITYYLVGKTPDEALKAKPQDTGEIRTTEIFRWDKGKWFY